MANLKKILPENVPGEFFVDSTCIDCDTCRQLAPSVFAETGEYSYVFHQPQGLEEERHAFHALLACPTASIGTLGKNKAPQFKQDFPMLLEDAVYYCGFNSEKSFGANTYFVRHPEGNWLIDSPRYLSFLKEQFEAMGGIRYIFLTHQDDVADADKYAQHFGSQRILHRRDSRAVADVEIKIEGEEPVAMGQDFMLIPTPGHTRGHCVLLYKNRFLFTGDHLAWSRTRHQLRAFRNACWYSWPEQIHSMEKLQDYSFEWVLPGHGDRIKLAPKIMKEEMTTLISWMKDVNDSRSP
jgi:glyoxylase-like metal-dependent hydrolase (beta-lactamase superfamily II)/ferredoxin